MNQPEVCGGPQFTDGVTNGADWYSVSGGFQDYNYIKHGTLHFTLELSCDKFPADEVVEQVVEENKIPLMTWMYYVSNKVASIYGDCGKPNTKVKFVLRDSNPEVFTWTVSNEVGWYKKSLPQVGMYDIFVGEEQVTHSNVHGPNTRLDLL